MIQAILHKSNGEFIMHVEFNQIPAEADTLEVDFKENEGGTRSFKFMGYDCEEYAHFVEVEHA